MFGVDMLDHEQRYDQGYEWFEIFSRLIRGERFDFKGRFYDVKDVYSVPTTVQQPRPVTMSAGGSPKGKAFAAHVADYLFGVVQNVPQAQQLVASVAGSAQDVGKRAGVFTISHVVCRETEQEAQAAYRYFADTMADDEGMANWTGAKAGTSQSVPEEAMRCEFGWPAGTVRSRWSVRPSTSQATSATCIAQASPGQRCRFWISGRSWNLLSGRCCPSWKRRACGLAELEPCKPLNRNPILMFVAEAILYC